MMLAHYYITPFKCLPLYSTHPSAEYLNRSVTGQTHRQIPLYHLADDTTTEEANEEGGEERCSSIVPNPSCLAVGVGVGVGVGEVGQSCWRIEQAPLRLTLELLVRSR
jgi:hypothetical protein